MATDREEYTSGFGGVIGSETPKQHVIDGWNIRNRDGNSVAIDGLVPFVQLIGLYSDPEIERLLRNSPDFGEREAIYVDANNTQIPWTEKEEGEQEQVSEEQAEYFRNQIQSKYVQLNILNYTNNSPDMWTPGIILASNVSQVGDEAYQYYAETRLPKDSGGVGITDLQIETGTKEFANRRYKMRITITDPQVLNDNPEYNKLANLQSKFLIIHGWANPDIIPDWEGAFDPPPRIIDVGLEGFPNGRMYINLRKDNRSGGMWSAATVTTTMFDFAFNEVGQLEASFTFMPAEISFLSTYRVPLVADNILRSLGTGEDEEPLDPDDPEQEGTGFMGYVAGFGAVAGEFGKNLAQIIYEEQQSYVSSDQRVADLFSNMDTDFSVSNVLRNYSEQMSDWAEDSSGAAARHSRAAARSRYRFPYAGPGITVYSNTEREIADPEDVDEKIMVTQHNSKIAYYYLGWVLETLRFSLWDLNRDRVREGQDPFNVRFKYYQIPDDSAFNLALQEKVTEGLLPSRAGMIAEIVRVAKTYFFPKKKIFDPIRQELKPGAGKDFKDNIRVEAITEERLNAWKVSQGNKWDLNGKYELMSPSNLDDPFFSDDGEWNSKTDDEKILYLTGGRTREAPGAAAARDELAEFEVAFSQLDRPTEEQVQEFQQRSAQARENTARVPVPADYRSSLVVDNSDNANQGVLRIMHPEFEGQLLYNYVIINDKAINVDFSSNQHRSGCAFYWGSENGDLKPCRTRQSGKVYDYGYRTGGFFWSKLRNFYVGENIGGLRNRSNFYEANRIKFKYSTDNDPHSAPGIVMPAVSARYYSPNDNYKFCQQKWYNLHIKYLRTEIEKIITERITEATKDDLSGIDNIMQEPVDLVWLTGRRYDHGLHYSPDNPSKMGEQLQYTGGFTPNYNLNNNTNICNVFESQGGMYPLDENFNALVQDILNRDTTEIFKEYNNDLTRLNEEQVEINLILNGPEGGAEALTSNYGYNQQQTALTNMDNPVNTWTVPDAVNTEEVLAGLEKQYSGLNGELEFWNNRLNKILVTLYNKDLINFDENQIEITETDEKTLAGEMAPPADMEDKYRGNAVDRKRINNTAARQFGPIMPGAGQRGYALLFVKNGIVVAEPGADINYDEMIEDNIERYLTVTFAGVSREINFDNINRVGDIDLKEGTGLEYLFLNFISPQDRNIVTSGFEFKNKADNGDQHALYILEQAENNYTNYISKVRERLNYYLQKINDTMSRLIHPEGFLEKIIIHKADIENKIANLNTFMTNVSQGFTGELSPFSPPTELDTTIYLERGGGRTMRLEGTPAQFWAMRFEKRTVDGLGDVKNYIPPVGGAEILKTKDRFFAWAPATQAPHGIYQGKRVMPANLASWDNVPKSIVDVDALSRLPEYEWQGEMYNVRGAMGANGDYQLDSKLNPGALIADQGAQVSANNIYWANMVDPAGGSEPLANPPTKVAYLVRAGIVNTALIRDILAKRYGWESVGFDRDFDEGMEKYIIGYWPSINILEKEVFGQNIPRYVGPAYLVDEDLDFCIQVKQISHGFSIDEAFTDDGYAQGVVRIKTGHFISL